MARYSEGRPYVAVPQGLRDNQSRSSTSERSEGPSKTAFFNQLPINRQSGSGKFLKKPAGSIIALIFEIFLCLVALCFIALGLVAVWIKNRPTGDTLGSAMEQAMRLGPTIYPILFAALISRSLKSIGRYCAQRSVRMSTLWALMNTNATADPVLHLLSMPASILVWALLVLWAMSPLGGQSTIRLLYKANLTSVAHPEIRYWDSGPLGNMFFYGHIMVGNDGSWPLSMRDMYSASLMQSVATKAGPLDQWGNVKIPRIEAGNMSQVDSDGWMPIQESLGPEAFTSLFGMPIVGLSELKSQGDLNFTIEATYVVLSPPSMYFNDTSDFGKGMTVECVDCGYTDSAYYIRTQRLLGLPVNETYIKSNANTPNYTEPRTLKFRSTAMTPTKGVTETTCQVTQRMVEAFINCVNGNCAATKVRPSTTDHRDKNFTSFDYWAWNVLDMITGTSYQAPARDVIWGSSTSLLFLNNSRAFPVQSGISGSPDYVDLHLIDPALISTRASILLNTGIQAFMAPTSFGGDLPTNLSLYGLPHIPAEGIQVYMDEAKSRGLDYSPTMSGHIRLLMLLDDFAPFVGASTNASLTRYMEVYRPDYAWAVILIVSSVFLFAVGVSGIIVRTKTMAPNMFDPVAGLTYGNPYLSSTEREDTPLDADDRANMFRDKRVQVGQVVDDGRPKAVFGEASYLTPLQLGVPYH